MERSSGSGLFFLFVFRCGGTGAETIAVITCFEDMTVMSEAIEESGRHLGVAEDLAPFTEAQIGGDDNTGMFVETAE